MKRLILTTAAIALMPGFALAESHSDDPIAKADDAMTQSEDSAAQSADAASEKIDPADQANPMHGTGTASDTDMADTSTDNTEQTAGQTPAMTSEQMSGEGEMETAAVVEDDPMSGDQTDVFGVAGDISANAIIGSQVHVAQGTWDDGMTFNAVSQDWERVGSVQDLVLGSDGKIEGIVAEVGGFLGIGDKFVLISMDELKLVPMDDGTLDVVTHYSNQDLTDMQAYEKANFR